jgi:hypothetical protein
MIQLTTPSSGASKRILYLTDKSGITDGYKKVFGEILSNAGIARQQVLVSSIYGLVPDALVKKGNRLALGFNPDRIAEITSAFNQRIAAATPDIIVCSCPAILGLLSNWDWSVATLDKCRGGVYHYHGIPVIIVAPITAIHRLVDERTLKNLEGDAVAYEPYRIKNGQWIVLRDWEKVGRFVHGKTIDFPEFQYSVCRTIEECVVARDWLASCKLIAVDIETGTYPAALTCNGFYGIQPDGRMRGFVIPFYDPTQEDGCFWQDEDDHLIAWDIQKQILNNPVPKTMQNGFYDCSYFIKYRLGVEKYIYDSMYLWFSLYPELPKTLDFISSILLDNFVYWKDDIKGTDNEKLSGQEGIELYWRYNVMDCYTTLCNTLRLMVVFENSPMMRTNYNDVWMRMQSGLAMSMRGIKADFKRLDYHRDTVLAEQQRAVARFRWMIDDPEFNINSPDQKKSLFYDVLGARKRNKRGRLIDVKKPLSGTNAPSVGAIPLKMIKTEHPFFAHIVTGLQEAMEPDKQLSNVFGRKNPETGFVTGGIKFFTPRFRTAFNPAGTTTTRFSSKGSNFWDGTNAQNIRETYRDWMVPDDGCLLFDVDHSQSDDVFMGYEANDAAKIAVIESGVDGHAVHGELFFGVPYAEIVSGKKSGDARIVHPTLGIRQISKRVVHGTNFQMAAITLFMTMGRDAVVAAAELLGFHDAAGWSDEKLIKICGYMMGQYRKKYPRFTQKEYYLDILNMLRTKGTVTNAFGIERRFLGDPNDSGTQREATGFVGQSDTAGNMNRTMYEIDHGWLPERFRDGINPDRLDRPRQMDWASHGFMFLLQIHDSFVGQVNLRHPNWRESLVNLLHVMNRPIIINGHTVRVKTEITLGRRWSKDSMIEWKGKDPHDLDRIAIATSA